MEEKKDSHNYKIYIAFGVLAALMILLFPQEGKFEYDYQKGRPWVHETLISPIDFPILKTENELLSEKEKKASEMVDYYLYDGSVSAAQIDRFGKAAVASNVDDAISQVITQQLSDVYEKGIVPSFNEESINDKIIFVKRGTRVENTPAMEVYDLEGAYEYVKANLLYSFPDSNIDSLLLAVNINSFIAPNLIFDNDVTQMLHKEAVDYISPTKGIIYAGQLIVSKGEIVTAEVEQLLDSYKAEYKMSFGYTGNATSLLISHIIFILALVALVYVTIRYVHPAVFGSMNKLIFILSLIFISFLGLVLIFKFDTNLLYLFPFSAFIIYTNAFFENKLIIPLYLLTLLPLLLIPDDGTVLMFANLVAGVVLLISFPRLNRGWLQFVNIIFVYAGLVIVYLAFEMSSGDGSIAWNSYNFLYLAINAVTVIVLYPFVFLFEKIFSLVSYTRLWELSDTNNRLLQDLAHKAPGTFQHSIQVANLAEFAAKEIGADAMLVKVGCLYHDIGKMENPMCFIENQAAGVDYHKDFTPLESARLIIKHVDDGVSLAAKHSIPELVADFIKTHHGRSKTLYFYNKYCNEGGDPANVEPFTYNGLLPVTKEHAIVMMADAVEAASRTLKSYSYESISTLVENILKSRLSDEQLVNADISFKEINMVKESLKQYLMQIYHARIVYPKRKN